MPAFKRGEARTFAKHGGQMILFTLFVNCHVLSVLYPFVMRWPFLCPSTQVPQFITSFVRVKGNQQENGWLSFYHRAVNEKSSTTRSKKQNRPRWPPMKQTESRQAATRGIFRPPTVFERKNNKQRNYYTYSCQLLWRITHVATRHSVCFPLALFFFLSS